MIVDLIVIIVVVRFFLELITNQDNSRIFVINVVRVVANGR